MSRTVRNDSFRKDSSKESAENKRSNKRIVRGKANAILRAMARDTELGYELTVPRYRGTGGRLTH